MKSSVEEIRRRFDNDVERFSNLETGQSSTVDAPVALELIARAAAATNPTATSLLDIGCGAGNYSLRLLQSLPALSVTLVDLSAPMLARAVERLRPKVAGEITAIQADIRGLSLGEARFDIIVAAAVFHHLRADSEWDAVFGACYGALKPGGSFWIFDLVEHEAPGIQALMRERWGDYLAELRSTSYRDDVFSYVEQEDTPKSLLYQTDLLRRVGFRTVEVLHKNGCFAAFGAIK